MKTLTTMTAAAMLIAGMSFASAQNATGPAGSSASPSNLNAAKKDSGSPMHSGSQASDPAMKTGTPKTAQTGTASPASPNAVPTRNGTAMSGSESGATAKASTPGTATTTGSADSATSPASGKKDPAKKTSGQ